MFCNKLLSLYQTVWSRRICFSFQMTMKDWRKATNKNIPVLSYHFFFFRGSEAGELNLSRVFTFICCFAAPVFKRFCCFHLSADFISNSDNFISSMISLKTGCQNLWRQTGAETHEVCAHVPLFFQIIFVFRALPTTPAFPIPASIRFAFFAVLLELITTFSWMTAPGLW